MLKGKELFLFIFIGNKSGEKKEDRRREEKFSWLQNWKKKILREKNNLYILG